jgi:hypothetical protein
METEALIAELARLKGGAPQAESRVLSILSHSTLFLVAEGDVSGDETAVTVKVRIASSQVCSSAYLFSSEELLRKWCEQLSIPAYPMPINGADLSLVLPKGTSIEIDPGTSHWVILTPSQIELLNNPGALSKWSSAPDDGLKTMIPTEQPTQQEAHDSQPPIAEAPNTANSEQESVKKKFFARGSPTTLFAAPAIEKKVDLSSRPRTYTSSNLKKVVRSNKPGEGEEG